MTATTPAPVLDLGLHLDDNVDLTVLLRAMRHCRRFFAIPSMTQFLGLLLEEYETLAPDRNVSTRDLKKTVRALDQHVDAMATSPSSLRSARHGDRSAQEFLAEWAALLRARRNASASSKRSSGKQQASCTHEAEREHERDAPSPSDSVNSLGATPCRTDGSTASEPPTPRVARSEGDMTPTNERSRERRRSHPASMTDATEFMRHRARAPGKRKRRLSTDPDTRLVESMMNRTREVECARQHMLEKQRLVEEERSRVASARLEYKQLKAALKECRQRDRDQKRVRQLLETSRGKPSASRSVNKERRRLQRLQQELSLRFQLMESESQRHDMQVEKQLAELRQECADLYLFPAPFPSEP